MTTVTETDHHYLSTPQLSFITGFFFNLKTVKEWRVIEVLLNVHLLFNRYHTRPLVIDYYALP